MRNCGRVVPSKDWELTDSVAARCETHCAVEIKIIRYNAFDTDVMPATCEDKRNL